MVGRSLRGASQKAGKSLIIECASFSKSSRYLPAKTFELVDRDKIDIGARPTSGSGRGLFDISPKAAHSRLWPKRGNAQWMRWIESDRTRWPPQMPTEEQNAFKHPTHRQIEHIAPDCSATVQDRDCTAETFRHNRIASQAKREVKRQA